MKSNLPLILLGIFLLSLGAALSQAKDMAKSMVPPKTYILGKPVSNQTITLLKTNLNNYFPMPLEISLMAQSRKFTLKSQDFDLALDIDKTVSQITLDSQTKKGFDILFQFVPFLASNRNYPVKISYNKDKLRSELDKIKALTDTPFLPTKLELLDGKIKLTSGQLGYSANVDKFESDLVSALTNYSMPEIFTLSYQENGSLPSADQVLATTATATSLLTKSLTFKLDDKQQIVTDASLVSWLDFNGSFDLDKINQYANSLSAVFRRDPVDASMKIENNKVLDFQPARDGIDLDIPQTTAFINENSLLLLHSKDKNLSVELPSKKTPPKIPTEAVNSLGIKELLGRGRSTFHHSSTTRNHNIATGASKVNRVLVAPGETFSFTQNLGPVGAETGFKEAYVIKAEGTQLEYGGGVCQVSTTMFRAMLNAGVNITARKNHSYRVSYYEEDMPPGYDATVYSPNPDLRFINDTPAHILVVNYFDGENKSLTYELWGTSDGRKSEITNYRQYGARSSPATKYIDDPTLPSGKLIRTETAVPGLNTSFDWKVVRAGQELYSKNFTSIFVPWAAVYRRGTGT